MALKQYLASNNQTLIKKLATVLTSENELFTPTFICVGHSSSKDWLVEALVRQNNIVGNCVFQKQHELIDMIHSTLLGGTSKKELYHSDHLQWFIFSVIRSSGFRSKFPEIAEYYKDDALMQYTLSEKITELFSNYQETAIDLIDLFNSGSKDQVNFEWQQYIWKELQQMTKGKFSSLPTAYRAIEEVLKSNESQKQLQSKIPNIHIYGDLNYTSEFIQFLSTIGRYTNVSIYRINFFNSKNTSRFVDNNNSFLKKNNQLFSEIDAILLEESEESSIQSNKTLLGVLQSEIEKGEQNIDFNYNNEDDSITIANCFTEYREVESLWHYLIHQFDKNKDLALRDICVIVPNIEKYAPAIKAVFKNEKASLDYTFYDSSSKIQDSPYKALLALYDFNSDEFTSKQVFSLLEFKYIRENFGISEDLSIIKKAIDDASIFHGFEGNEDLETHYVSWKYGLKRLIFGACIERSDEIIKEKKDTKDFYPVSEFEDKSFYELIKLNQFVEALNNFSKSRKLDNTLLEWHTSIKKTIEDFLNVTEYEPSNFDRKLEQLVKSHKVIETENIDFKVIHYYLKKLFDNDDVSSRIGFGGIRFVSPNPLMVTSFKVNCFLGLNGSDFPRSSNKLSFDLRENAQITSSNELDKHLFLSLIQGAKEKLYISYIGQSSKDNSVIPASTLVEDLVSVCKKWKITAEDMLVKHPLHSFSNKYNSTKHPRLIRFDEGFGNRSGLQIDHNAKNPEVLKRDNKGRIIIPLQDLIRFAEDPIKHYYNKVLGIYYSDRTVDLEECELFDLDNLKKWNIKNSILQSELKQKNDEKEFYQHLKMNGFFPLKNLGERFKKSISKEVYNVIESINGKVDLESQETFSMDIELNDKYVIEGTIDSIFNDTFLFATVSSDKWKYQLRSVIQFLTVIISSDNLISMGYYVSKDKTKDLKCTYDNAQTYLFQLCSNYEEGISNLKHFSVDFGAKLIDVFGKERTDELYVESLKGIINNDHLFINPSEYFMRELNNGSMTNKDSMETFKNYYLFINELLTSTLS